MEVVAEGVETQEQLDLLVDLGCAQGQGYHFARPMPASEASAFLTGRRNPANSIFTPRTRAAVVVSST
ncbi:MAG: EAL domain-containing protein [Actinomycetota bacterium]|nr:EAL domain-containing protein [Actinomycetota bacterium]